MKNGMKNGHGGTMQSRNKHFINTFHANIYTIIIY